MIDVVKLQQKIINEPDYITKILESLNFSHIVDRHDFLQFPNKDGDNLSANSVRKKDLVWQNWTRNKKGNLITLVMDDKHYSFAEALRWIANKIGLAATQSVHVQLPFSGFYKKLIHDESAIYTPNSKIYSEDRLPTPMGVSKKFFDDGIALNVQEEFGVRYSLEDDAILIPIKDEYGQLVGCKARRNSEVDFGQRWYAYLPYMKTSFVYGYYENYSSIITKSICIIFESEKAVMQCKSFGMSVAVAVAGHNISHTQVSKIKGLMTSKIIVAFDNDISDDEKAYECQKLLSDNILINNKVGYIRQSDLLGEKDSPSDKGKEVFTELLKEYVVWIGEENGKSE